MDSSRIGSQLSVQIKRGMGMRARALLGLGTFLFACGTDNADPMPSDDGMTNAPPSGTTAGSSDTAPNAPSGDGDSSATSGVEEAAPPGTGEAAPPGMGEAAPSGMEEAATPGIGTELVGADAPGEGEGAGSATTDTDDGTAEDSAGSEDGAETLSAGCGTTRGLMDGRRTIHPADFRLERARRGYVALDSVSRERARDAHLRRADLRAR